MDIEREKAMAMGAAIKALVDKYDLPMEEAFEVATQATKDYLDSVLDEYRNQ